MPDQQPLTDDEVHERLVEAMYALGRRPAETVRGQTALDAAKRTMSLLQFGLLKAMNDAVDQVPGVLPDGPSTRV